MNQQTSIRDEVGTPHDRLRSEVGPDPRLSTMGLAVLCALGLVAVGVIGPRSARADDGRGGIDGDEITAEIDGSGGSSSANPDRCTWRSVTRTDPSGGAPRPVERRIGSKTQVLMTFECLGPPPRSGRKWITRVSTGGNGASARRRLPAPDVTTAPPADRGVVNVGTWYWVSRAVWKPWSVTAGVVTPAGPVTVTTTARPFRLILDPGDGRGPVSCTGPGRPWTPAFGDDARSACMYTWSRASTSLPGASFRAALSIEWKVTWRSSTGASGRLPNIRTSTPFMARVREIQAVAAR